MKKGRITFEKSRSKYQDSGMTADASCNYLITRDFDVRWKKQNFKNKKS
jgi:hypothetical protein